MKIGIIIHSFTGNTLSVAKRLHDKLSKAGNSVNIEQITLVGGEQQNQSFFRIENAPDVSKYDALIFGAPVRGFSLSPVMSMYLSNVGSLKGKKVGCFVTQFFPYKWMGGNQSIGSMKKLCESKDAVVSGTGIVNWKNPQREKIIAEVVEYFYGLF